MERKKQEEEKAAIHRSAKGWKAFVKEICVKECRRIGRATTYQDLLQIEIQLHHLMVWVNSSLSL